MAVAGRPVRLTPTEYELLFELSVHAGRVLTHDRLLQRVWGLRSSAASWATTPTTPPTSSTSPASDTGWRRERGRNRWR